MEDAASAGRELYEDRPGSIRSVGMGKWTTGKASARRTYLEEEGSPGRRVSATRCR